jgi:hypothetical protein
MAGRNESGRTLLPQFWRISDADRQCFTNRSERNKLQISFGRLASMPEVAKRWSAAVFSALPLAIAALVNFVFLANPPLQAALPWLGLLLAAAALVVLTMGLRHAFVRAQIYRGKVLSIVLAVITLIVSGANVFVFFLARALPNSTAAPQVGRQLPDFTLADTAGQSVSLDSLFASSPNDPLSPSPKALLLIFYRGYW